MLWMTRAVSTVGHPAWPMELPLSEFYAHERLRQVGDDDALAGLLGHTDLYLMAVGQSSVKGESCGEPVRRRVRIVFCMGDGTWWLSSAERERHLGSTVRDVSAH